MWVFASLRGSVRGVLDGLPHFLGTIEAVSSLPLGASGLVNCASSETSGIGGLPRFLGTTDAVSSWAPGKSGVCFGTVKIRDKMFCGVKAWFEWLGVDLEDLLIDI